MSYVLVRFGQSSTTYLAWFLRFAVSKSVKVRLTPPPIVIHGYTPTVYGSLIMKPENTILYSSCLECRKWISHKWIGLEDLSPYCVKPNIFRQTCIVHHNFNRFYALLSKKIATLLRRIWSALTTGRPFTWVLCWLLPSYKEHAVFIFKKDLSSAHAVKVFWEYSRSRTNWNGTYTIRCPIKRHIVEISKTRHINPK